MKALVSFAASILALGGCSAPGSTASPLIPDKAIQLTAGNSVALSSVATAAVIGAAVHVYYDPLAPNWEVEESRLNGDTYRFALKMKRYQTGGSGESLQVIRRRASQLQYEQGFGAYEILEYTEGIESQTLGAKRRADAVVRLVQRQQADSFRQGVN